MKYFENARYRLLSVALCVACMIGSMSAYATTGNELLANCKSDGDFQSAYCLGYISGYADYLISINRVCSPDGATYGQFKTIVVNWMQSRPEVLHYIAFQLVNNALLEVFPCTE